MMTMEQTLALAERVKKTQKSLKQAYEECNMLVKDACSEFEQKRKEREEEHKKKAQKEASYVYIMLI